AAALDLRPVLPEVWPRRAALGLRPIGCRVREIVDGAAQHAEELVETVADGIELGLPAEVPLADQRGRVARGLKPYPDGCVPRRQTDLRRAARERLLEPDGEALRRSEEHT